MFYKKEITATNFKGKVNLAGKDFCQHKYAYYKYLRENDPVHQGKIMVIKSYLLANYEDCHAVTTDKRFIRERERITGGNRFPIPMTKTLKLMMNNMIAVDEPEHRRLKVLVHKAFSPRRVQALADRVESLAHELIDKAEAKGEIHLKSEYSRPIPTTVIAEMMGIEMSEMDGMDNMMKAMVAGGSSGMGMLSALIFRLPKAIKFMRQLVNRKRNTPGDDILTGLIQAEEDGDKLSENELVSMAFLLIVAGFETTYNLITNSVYTLLKHPDQLEKLRQNSDLMNSAVEELLRYNSPIHSTKPIFPIEDITIKGVTIPKGAMVMPLLASGNHDPEVFDRPEVFDIERDPNKHLSFSMGTHYCLGASLARLETAMALKVLIERCPNMRLGIERDIPLVKRPGWHEYTQMPIKLS